MAVLLTAGAIATVAIGLLGTPVYQRAVTLGLTRSKIDNVHGLDLKLLPETVACEDLHYEPYSNKLYTSCQGDNAKRSAWFPPLLQFDVSASTAEGTIVVIDPDTFIPKTLAYTNFVGALIPHGIEIFTDPNDPTTTYVFVVNHLANPDYYEASPRASEVKGLEHIEVFRHVHGEDSVEHIRTVRHPLVHTANDIAALSATSFYVTNDHYYAEGSMRMVEELGTRGSAPWSNTIYVEFDPEEKDPSAGVSAHVALTGLHNNNGLGHGRPGYPEINVIDASGGVLYRAQHFTNHSLEILESIPLHITLDNPFYYEDKYATPGNNASGYLVSGLARAANLAKDFKDPAKPLPVAAYHIRSNEHTVDFLSGSNKWEKRLVFQDDGKTLRSASGAVLTGIDPATTGGKKQAWLWVTGFGSNALAVMKIDL